MGPQAVHEHFKKEEGTLRLEVTLSCLGLLFSSPVVQELTD